MKQLLSVLILAVIAATGLTSFAATETATISTPYGYGEDKVQKITWSNLQGGDSGSAVKVANWTKKSVVFTGTWTGVSATIQGSNDGTNYFALTDEQGVALTFSANSLKTIGPNTLYIKPVVTGGASGTIAVDLIIAK